jgi:hypothetical protein
MSAKTIIGRLVVFAAAGAGTAGFLMTAPTAAAEPAACSQFGFNGPVLVNLSDGKSLSLNSTGADASGPATLRGLPGIPQADGQIVGHISQRHVDVTFTWTHPVGANDKLLTDTVPLSGDVGNDGKARGAGWETANPLACVQETPKQGPTVSWDPILGGLVAHITDRSGVTSQCTYTSDFYTRSFALNANSTFDLKIIPAIPKFQNWDVTIDCDNGTNTHTTTFF